MNLQNDYLLLLKIAAANSDNRTIVDDFSFAESFPLLAKPPFLYCQGPLESATVLFSVHL